MKKFTEDEKEKVIADLLFCREHGDGEYSVYEDLYEYENFAFDEDACNAAWQEVLEAAKQEDKSSLKKEDPAIAGVIDDVEAFVYKIWTEASESTKDKVWQYVKEYWDCLPTCSTPTRCDEAIEENIVDFITYNVPCEIEPDRLLGKDGFAGTTVKSLEDLYKIM